MTHADATALPLFSTGKMLPLSLTGGITIELELGDYTDCFSVDAAHPNLWAISQPEILVDTISVVSSLSNSYAQAPFSGPFRYCIFFSFQTSVTDPSSVSISIQRGFCCLTTPIRSLDMHVNEF